MKLKHYFCHFSIVFLASCTPKNMTYINSIYDYRKQIRENFKNDPRAPLNTNEELNLLDYYPVDPKYKLNCDVHIPESTTLLSIPTYSGKEKFYQIYAQASCSFEKQVFNLNIYRSADGPQNPIYQYHLFLPFKDETNSAETFGGGRYIDLNVNQIKNGKVIIDFNKAYNPWCAYSDGYNCPIPPIENHLRIPIRAGEKNYKGEYKTKNDTSY